MQQIAKENIYAHQIKSKILGKINQNFESKSSMLQSSQIAKEFLPPQDELNQDINSYIINNIIRNYDSQQLAKGQQLMSTTRPNKINNNNDYENIQVKYQPYIDQKLSHSIQYDPEDFSGKFFNKPFSKLLSNQKIQRPKSSKNYKLQESNIFNKNKYYYQKESKLFQQSFSQKKDYNFQYDKKKIQEIKDNSYYSQQEYLSQSTFNNKKVSKLQNLSKNSQVSSQIDLTRQNPKTQKSEKTIKNYKMKTFNIQQKPKFDLSQNQKDLLSQILVSNKKTWSNKEQEVSDEEESDISLSKLSPSIKSIKIKDKFEGINLQQINQSLQKQEIQNNTQQNNLVKSQQLIDNTAQNLDKKESQNQINKQSLKYSRSQRTMIRIQNNNMFDKDVQESLSQMSPILVFDKVEQQMAKKIYQFYKNTKNKKQYFFKEFQLDLENRQIEILQKNIQLKQIWDDQQESQIKGQIKVIYLINEQKIMFIFKNRFTFAFFIEDLQLQENNKIIQFGKDLFYNFQSFIYIKKQLRLQINNNYQEIFKKSNLQFIQLNFVEFKIKKQEQIKQEQIQENKDDFIFKNLQYLLSQNQNKKQEYENQISKIELQLQNLKNNHCSTEQLKNMIQTIEDIQKKQEYSKVLDQLQKSKSILDKNIQDSMSQFFQVKNIQKSQKISQQSQEDFDIVADQIFEYLNQNISQNDATCFDNVCNQDITPLSNNNSQTNQQQYKSKILAYLESVSNKKEITKCKEIENEENYKNFNQLCEFQISSQSQLNEKSLDKTSVIIDDLIFEAIYNQKQFLELQQILQQQQYEQQKIIQNVVQNENVNSNDQNVNQNDQNVIQNLQIEQKAIQNKQIQKQKSYNIQQKAIQNDLLQTQKSYNIKDNNDEMIFKPITKMKSDQKDSNKQDYLFKSNQILPKEKQQLIVKIDETSIINLSQNRPPKYNQKLSNIYQTFFKKKKTLLSDSDLNSLNQIKMSGKKRNQMRLKKERYLIKMLNLFQRTHQNYNKFLDQFNLKCHFFDQLQQNLDRCDELNLLEKDLFQIQSEKNISGFDANIIYNYQNQQFFFFCNVLAVKPCLMRLPATDVQEILFMQNELERRICLVENGDDKGLFFNPPYQDKIMSWSINIVLKNLFPFTKYGKNNSFKIHKNINKLYTSTKISIYFWNEEEGYIKSIKLDETYIFFLQIQNSLHDLDFMCTQLNKYLDFDRYCFKPYPYQLLVGQKQIQVLKNNWIHLNSSYDQVDLSVYFIYDTKSLLIYCGNQLIYVKRNIQYYKKHEIKYITQCVLDKIFIVKFKNQNFFYYEENNDNKFKMIYYEKFMIFGQKVVVKAVRDNQLMLFNIETFVTQFQTRILTYYTQYYNFRKMFDLNKKNIIYDLKRNLFLISQEFLKYLEYELGDQNQICNYLKIQNLIHKKQNENYFQFSNVLQQINRQLNFNINCKGYEDLKYQIIESGPEKSVELDRSNIQYYHYLNYKMMDSIQKIPSYKEQIQAIHMKK